MKKKSLIESLKSTRKANIISTAAKNEAAENKGTSTRKGKFARQKMARYKMFK